MASVASKLMTVEEFYDFVHRPENRDRQFELEQGELVEMSRPGELHCVVCGNVAGIFWTWCRQRKKGRVCPNDMGLILERDPDTLRGADVAVYTESKKYVNLDPKYPAELPALVMLPSRMSPIWGR